MQRIFTLLATLFVPLTLIAATPELQTPTTTANAVASCECDDCNDDQKWEFWWSAGANIASNYLWRGYDQPYTGNMFDPSFQPSVTLGYGLFYIDLWYNISTLSTYQELDMTLGFEYEGLSITVYDVWCANGKDFWQNDFLDGDNHSLTATIDYTFFNRLRLHWGTTFIHSADFLTEGKRAGKRAFSSYFEVAYTQPVKDLFDITFTAGASPWTGPFWCAGPRTLQDGAYALDFDNLPKGFNVTNLSINLCREFEVGSCTIPVNVGYTYNPTTNRHYPIIKTGFSF